MVYYPQMDTLGGLMKRLGFETVVVGLTVAIVFGINAAFSWSNQNTLPIGISLLIFLYLIAIAEYVRQKRIPVSTV